MKAKQPIPYIQMSSFTSQPPTEIATVQPVIHFNDLPFLGYTTFPSNLSLYQSPQLKRFLLQAVQNNEMLHVRQILNHFKSQNKNQTIADIVDQPTFNNETKIFELVYDYERGINSKEAVRSWLSNKNFDSFTPLHFAAYRGNIKILQILKSSGVSFEVKNDQGRNCLSIAAQSDQVTTIIWLRNNGVDYLEFDNKQATPLHWAAYFGCENTVALYLNWLEKENLTSRILNLQDLDGMSCLHLAILSRNINLVRKLIMHGSDTRLKDFKARDSLQIAVENDLKDVQLQIRKNYCNNNYKQNTSQSNNQQETQTSEVFYTVLYRVLPVLLLYCRNSLLHIPVPKREVGNSGVSCAIGSEYLALHPSCNDESGVLQSFVRQRITIQLVPNEPAKSHLLLLHLDKAQTIKTLPSLLTMHQGV